MVLIGVPEMEDETIEYRWQGETMVYVITADINGSGSLYVESMDPTGRPFLQDVSNEDAAYNAMVEHILKRSKEE